jgi:hypothetical protein
VEGIVQLLTVEAGRNRNNAAQAFHGSLS